MTPTDKQGNSRDLYFDTDCLALLEQKWFLSKKQISVSAATIYFADEDNKIITPLHKAYKRGTSGSKWKQAYQALKHDRKKTLRNANIKNLLHALGALYILNLYYRDERTDLGRVYLGDNFFDNRVGSEVFSAYYCSASSLEMQTYMDDSCITPPLGNEIEKAIYILKYDDESYKEMHKNYCLDNQITLERYNNSSTIKEFLANNPDYADKSINEVCIAAGGIRLLSQIIYLENTKAEKNSRMEAMINKHTCIYPKLFPLSKKAN